MVNPADLKIGDILSYRALFNHGDSRETVQGVYLGRSPSYPDHADARWFRYNVPFQWNPASVGIWREPIPFSQCRKLMGISSVRNPMVRAEVEIELRLVLDGKIELWQREQEEGV